jgi:hypothetical protein
MNKNRGRYRFTIEDRILLHLLDFTKWRDKIDIPLNVTQEGISRGVGVKKKHVPRSLRKMIEKDLLLERTTHVISKPQRMKTYHLTFKGEERARRLRNHVKSITIKVMGGSHNVKEMAIADLGDMLKDSFSLAEVLTHISDDGVLDMEDMKKIGEDMKGDAGQDNLEIYKQALVQVWKDGRMSSDEREILRILRDSLNVSEKDHLRLEEEILENAEKDSDGKVMAVYKVALEQALEDGKITDDERAILEKIKEQFKIADE